MRLYTFRNFDEVSLLEDKKNGKYPTVPFTLHKSSSVMSAYWGRNSITLAIPILLNVYVFLILTFR